MRRITNANVLRDFEALGVHYGNVVCPAIGYVEGLLIGRERQANWLLKARITIPIT